MRKRRRTDTLTNILGRDFADDASGVFGRGHFRLLLSPVGEAKDAF